MSVLWAWFQFAQESGQVVIDQWLANLMFGTLFAGSIAIVGFSGKMLLETSANVKAAAQKLEDLEEQADDHESRLRALEKRAHP